MTTAQARSFGVRVGGVPLLLPTDAGLEYVAAAPVFPLPRAGRRIVGLMQLRGHPVVVLDGAPQPAPPAAEARRLSVLVIGAAPEAGALVVDAPPHDLLSTSDAPAAAVRPACAFSTALADPVADASGGLWWRFDPRRLFEALARAQ